LSSANRGPQRGLYRVADQAAWKKKSSIRDIPHVDRPREKLVSKGPEMLSTVELVTVILGSGTKTRTVQQIARAILQKLNKQADHIDVKGLLAIEGVGLAKACQIVASLEFARRRLPKDNLCIQSADDVLPIISHIADKKQEHLLCISLNGANEVIGNRLITVGLLTTTQVHPREVFADAVAERAAFVILAHNHPSGVLEPTADDLTSTRQLIEAGRILGIPVLDHIIISKRGYVSFKEIGLM